MFTSQHQKMLIVNQLEALITRL